MPDAVSGNLKTVFRERDEPAYQDHNPKRAAFELQMPVPRKRHEYIRYRQ